MPQIHIIYVSSFCISYTDCIDNQQSAAISYVLRREVLYQLRRSIPDVDLICAMYSEGIETACRR